MPRGTKHPAIGWALAVVLAIVIVFPLAWGIFYWGVILPVEQQSIAEFGTGIYEPTTLAFIEVITGGWPLIISILTLYWLWVQSHKKDLTAF